MLVDALRETYALPELLAELGLARSSYFYHRARFQVADKYVGVRRIITEIFEHNHHCYGYRRIRASLGRQDVLHLGEGRAAFDEARAPDHRHAKRRRYGSYLGEISPAPENLINRDFQAATPTKNGSLTSRSSTSRPARCIYRR